MHGQEIAAEIVVKQEEHEYGRGEISSWRQAKIRIKKEGELKGETDSKNTIWTAKRGDERLKIEETRKLERKTKKIGYERKQNIKGMESKELKEDERKNA
jgi:hypothetical protein